MFTKSSHAAIAAFLLGATSALPADTLSLQQYVQLAVRHNPQSRIAASAVDASTASRQIAFARLLPSVNANAGASGSGQNALSSSSKSSGGTYSTSTGVSANVLVYDFGKTPRELKAADKSLEAARFDQQNTEQQTILDARTAYFSYLFAAQVLDVNEDALKQAHLHYDQAKALVDVGKQAQIVVIKANVDVANAQVNEIHAKNALSLARVQLETTAGAPLADPLALTDSLNVAEDSIAPADALTKAQQARPELLSAKAQLEAVRMQDAAARVSYLPSVGANGGYNWRGTSTTSIRLPDWGSPAWNLGATLSVPLYQGGAVRASVRQADAALSKSEASFDQTVRTIVQEVQQRYLEEAEARQRIGATAVLVEQASEGLRMSQERFRNGAAASIEIIDAEVALANARISHVQAQFDCRTAHSRLLLAMGGLHE